MGYVVSLPGALFPDSLQMLITYQTNVSPNGTSVTTLWRTIRSNKEDRVAKFEWAANGGLGRVVIGKVRSLSSSASHS
jgi:hypothetical protein